ncbi:benzoate 4-monooxygenase cytochrome P450 [Cladophialophora carrionii]|uniref:Benzoate 4-monooxygenase cytochrome P450 n=1 Tax=Cladophialophora carrionii TaxID=86049 RepID=A0A1C1D1A5_9EURO|nr:benzoate 4-monooxygenase cytochrome P450 [Cladophialophora carrionii]
MDLLSCALLVTSIGITLLFSFLVLNSRQAGLSHIPGPFLARYTDAWALYNAWRGIHFHNKVHVQRGLQARYGDVVRTGPRSVTVFDPAAVPVIYGVRSKLDKGNAYVPFRQAGVTTSLLSIPDEKTHSQYRKLVSNAYSMTSLKGYEPYVDDMVNRFVEVCNQHAFAGKPMNLSLWCQYYCFDVVSKITMGMPLGSMKGEGHDAYGLVQRVRAFGFYSGLVSQMPWLHKILQDNPLMRKTRPSPFMKVVGGTVQARLRTPDPEDQPRPDLLSHFVATHAGYPRLMDEKQVLIMTSGNLIAGGLSPSAAFDELCRYLATHPDSQDKLYGELQQAQCRLPASYDHVKNLPYLEGTIREAYRLHSSTSFNLQRVTGAAGLELPNGVRIPPNTNIGCPAGAINQDVRVYGADADEYNPERWMQRENETIEAYLERRKLMERTDMTFGQGSRACIGKNVAFLEFFKAVATLMAQFKVRQPVPSTPEEVLNFAVQDRLLTHDSNSLNVLEK